jgi:hypothetical protein
VGQFYKRHPLADLSGQETSDLYIPQHSYEARLLEEREAELVKLLVALGATKIRITSNIEEQNSDKINAGLNVDAIVGGGGAAYKGSKQGKARTLDTREFTLSRKQWGRHKIGKRELSLASVRASLESGSFRT